MSKADEVEYEKTPKAAEEVEINLEELEPPIPPDGGWAWLVLLGSVVCMFCVDGLSFSFGVLLTDLQSSFGCSKTKISLAGSLIVGCTLISGPIVSAISNKFSFRALVIAGTVVSFCSVFACAFIHDVNYFIVLFGVITGTSYGLIYLPAATIVSQWFAKRRATATGISMCGSGIGTTVYSFVLPILEKNYTWRGCMMLMAAVSLNCIAAGCLFIPLREYHKSRSFKKPSMNGLPAEDLHGPPASLSADSRRGVKPWRTRSSNSGSVAETGYLRHIDSDIEACSLTMAERGDRPSKHVSKRPSPVRENGLLEFSTSHHSSASQFGSKQRCGGASATPVVGLSTVARVVGEVISQDQHHNRHHHPRRRTVSARSGSPPPMSVEPSSGASFCVKHDRRGGSQLFTSSVSLRPTTESGVKADATLRQKVVSQLEREMDMPANRKDFFHSGSMIHVNEYLSSSTMNEYVRSVTRIATAETDDAAAAAVVAGSVEGGGEAVVAVGSSSNYVLAMLSELFDIGLLKSPTFILLLVSSVSGLVGYPVPYMFLQDEAQTVGLSAKSSAHLVVYMCAVNTVGRVAAGVISDWRCTDALVVNNLALIISGIACIVLPLTPSYGSHVCFAVTYGLAIAAFVSLRIILLVEMLGLERLTNAFGFLLLFQGFAFMASPPLLAGFYDLLQSYDYTFFLGGGSLILSALLCFPLRPILRWEKRRRGEIVAPPDSGCCLRLIRRIRDRLV